MPKARCLISPRLLREREPELSDPRHEDRIRRGVRKFRDALSCREDDVREPHRLVLVLLDVLRDMERAVYRDRGARAPENIPIERQHETRISLKRDLAVLGDDIDAGRKRGRHLGRYRHVTQLLKLAT